ncbi:hypothetical protein J7T55_013226 [Diaporthe amygdali]|uniref:uncharacterized protein n=1 Tax=Phomopsis amygdali TaxID=1214568 RepID=UPI0022FE63EB|nr:uncharacterized protein J7T55_013226 [Diaporthe amygdali]KAJ0118991.1 hypothetical protein J7T55_013226 [Diaporthe amygdali]
MPSADSTHEVVPANRGYRHYFFAFTPQCMRLESGHPCQDDQFGVTNLSTKPGFIPNERVDQSNLSKHIIKSVGAVVREHEASDYMQINYGAPEIQAAVMHANMPLARFIVHCPPCISAITTAVHLCQANKDAITEWSVRVDHRLDCACCPSTTSALERLSMIADTIVDAGTGHHWAKPDSSEAQWMKWIDRAWLEGVLYDADDHTTASAPSSSKPTTNAGRDYAGIRHLLSFEGRVRENTVAVILADVDSASWIINASPFPTVKRQPRAGEMFHMKEETVGRTFTRSFLGTFETKGALKRRRVSSPPPETTRSGRKTLAQRKGRSTKQLFDQDELM